MKRIGRDILFIFPLFMIRDSEQQPSSRAVITIIDLLTFNRPFWYIEQMEPRAQADGGSNKIPVSGEYPGSIPAIDPRLSVDEALDRLSSGNAEFAPVIDPATGHVVGFLSRTSIIVNAPPTVSAETTLEPVRFGGMATPLGVYLTDGVSAGGAGFFGLVLTGMVISSLALAAQIITTVVIHYVTGSLDALVISGRLPFISRIWFIQALGLLPLPLVFMMLRLVPMSGVHAAEHQVVHCIERGEELKCEIVKTMPRVHPRCGTNICTGFSLFLFVFLAVFSVAQRYRMPIADCASIALLAAAPVALTYWRRVGGFIQQWFVTRPATDLQIAGAITAANQLMSRRAAHEAAFPEGSSHPAANGEANNTGGKMSLESMAADWVDGIKRIWCMGLAQVALGYFAVLTPVNLAAHHWAWLSQILEI